MRRAANEKLRRDERIFHCERRFYWPFYGTNKRPRYADLHTACFVIHRLPFARHPSSIPFLRFLLSSFSAQQYVSRWLLAFQRGEKQRLPPERRISRIVRSNGANAARLRFRKYLHFAATLLVSSRGRRTTLIFRTRFIRLLCR